MTRLNKQEQEINIYFTKIKKEEREKYETKRTGSRKSY